jgi:2-oxoglutarate ferredoxin oxidoreductase subunit delta
MARGMVVIDADRCKGCGLCTHICPVNILALSTEAFNARGYHPVRVTDAEACIGCASCATICPDVVFTVYRQKRETRSRSAVAAAEG